MSEYIFPDERAAAAADRQDEAERRWAEERRVSPPADPVPPEPTRPWVDVDESKRDIVFRVRTILDDAKHILPDTESRLVFLAASLEARTWEVEVLTGQIERLKELLADANRRASMYLTKGIA